MGAITGFHRRGGCQDRRIENPGTARENFGMDGFLSRRAANEEAVCSLALFLDAANAVTMTKGPQFHRFPRDRRYMPARSLGSGARVGRCRNKQLQTLLSKCEPVYVARHWHCQGWSASERCGGGTGILVAGLKYIGLKNSTEPFGLSRREGGGAMLLECTHRE